jgi:hypothetical protein
LAALANPGSTPQIYSIEWTEYTMETRVIDNRTFLFGLDELYRDAMKAQERGELLCHARDLAQRLGVAPAKVPVEGYYCEERTLTEYFLLMRGLQSVRSDRAKGVSSTAAYQRLYAVTSSRLFGEPPDPDWLLPSGNDSLTRAMGTTDEWTVPNLTAIAHREAVDGDGYALVTLAALARDPIVLTALRESVVLYVQLGFLSTKTEKPVYEWQVDPELAERATRFVATFNALFPVGSTLPEPIPENADLFWSANPEARIAGRCVRLGTNPSGRHYHWALRLRPDIAALEVDEFWADEIWTTQRYKESDRFLRPYSIELS